MRAEPSHGAAERRDVSVSVQRAQQREEGAGGGHGIGRWRGDPAERGHVPRPPAGQFEHERREVGCEDFGRVERPPVGIFEAGPQAVAHSGGGSTRPAAALIQVGESLHRVYAGVDMTVSTAAGAVHLRVEQLDADGVRIALPQFDQTLVLR